jgi:Flp pilus assembly protein TadD
VPILVGPNRSHVIPAEFEEPAPRPIAKAPKLGPAPKRADVAIVPEIARPRAANRADADRLVETGRTAFADGQYGRALERFRRAAEITPNEPSAHYLVSQAHFALGKYREAVAAIAAGMALRADWSEARFHSRDLYGPKPANFDLHLADLRRAVEMFPEDATLLFLLGHQLWFDGKHGEAKPLILKARAVGKDQTPAGAFVLQ